MTEQPERAYVLGMAIGTVIGAVLRLLGARPATVRNWAAPRAAKWDAVAHPDRAWDVPDITRPTIPAWHAGIAPDALIAMSGGDADPSPVEVDRLIELRATWGERGHDER